MANLGRGRECAVLPAGCWLSLPIRYDKQRHGYCYSHPVAHFPGVTVSESELFAILVAQKAVANYKGTPFYKPLVITFNRLSFHLDNLDEVAPWVLNLGIHATVVRPKALADRVQAAARGIVRRYEEPGERQEPSGQENLRLNGT